MSFVGDPIVALRFNMPWSSCLEDASRLRSGSSPLKVEQVIDKSSREFQIDARTFFMLQGPGLFRILLLLLAD